MDIGLPPASPSDKDIDLKVSLHYYQVWGQDDWILAKVFVCLSVCFYGPRRSQGP